MEDLHEIKKILDHCGDTLLRIEKNLDRYIWLGNEENQHSYFFIDLVDCVDCVG